MNIQELIDFRKTLHRYPEVSGEERETARKASEFLKHSDPDEIITGVGGNGIIAVYKGDADGKNVLIRCELDALPIAEVNNFIYSSENQGQGHMCGHDGHMAIVAGLSRKLKEDRPEKGTILLLFQPAEENGEGARAVIMDKRFIQLKPDYVFALHNLPGYPKNEIVLKRGTFTAAVNSMIISLTGKTSHAGEPDKGINPALAMAEIIVDINKLNNPDTFDNFRQISYIHASMGEKAYGVSAGEAELGFTFRCWTTEERDQLGQQMAGLAKRIGAKHKLQVNISYTESFHANKNADEAIDIIDKAATNLNYSVTWQPLPHRFGEDFGLFTDKYTGALFGLGSGENTPALHNPDYDFPDDIINTGIDMFYRIIREINK